jgi:DNA-binding transcriptional MerR regulator
VWRRREGEEVTESAKERPLKDLSLEESDAYIDEIDAMSLEELEDRLPEAQEALEVIETKLEELMGLRDAALVCAAAMAARLAALKQAGDRPG